LGKPSRQFYLDTPQPFRGDFADRAKQHPSLNYGHASDSDNTWDFQTRTGKVRVIFMYDFIKLFHIVPRL